MPTYLRPERAEMDASVARSCGSKFRRHKLALSVRGVSGVLLSDTAGWRGSFRAPYTHQRNAMPNTSMRRRKAIKTFGTNWCQFVGPIVLQERRKRRIWSIFAGLRYRHRYQQARAKIEYFCKGKPTTSLPSSNRYHVCFCAPDGGHSGSSGARTGWAAMCQPAFPLWRQLSLTGG